MSNRNGIFLEKVLNPACLLAWVGLHSVGGSDLRAQNSACCETLSVKYSFTAVLERWPGEVAYFVCYLPVEVAAEIDSVTEGLRAGFGSVRVQVRLGASAWKTSIFKEARRNSYLMLVKKQVRVAEGLLEGDSLALEIELVDF